MLHAFFKDCHQNNGEIKPESLSTAPQLHRFETVIHYPQGPPDSTLHELAALYSVRKHQKSYALFHA